MDFITRKIAYLWLRYTERSVNRSIRKYADLHERATKNDNFISIGAYWYYPDDLTGSNLRLGHWKKHFNDDGIKYDNFYINQFNEYVENIENGSWTKKYLFFAKCLKRRLPQMKQAHKYDTLWIDRGIIPFYPRSNAYLEKQLKRVVKKLVVDTTDGDDYKGNPVLMEDVLSEADEITVGYKYLKEFYEDRFKVTQVFWTIPTDKYKIKTSNTILGKPIIGWMGSPGNFEQIRKLIPTLVEIHKVTPFIFRYICRENFDSEFENMEVDHHFFGDDYYELIASFDIGISPFLEKNLSTKGKIAMKHQEFLLMGIPQVCSDVAISEFVRHGEHVIISSNLEEWGKSLIQLLNDGELRESLSIRSKELFMKYYCYEGQYESLKNVLTVR